MRACMFCGSKTIAFYVSSEDKYICPKHYEVARKELGEEAVKGFYKNKIVVKNGIGYMDIYNNKYNKKETVLIDPENIDLIKNMRWHTKKDGSVITYIAPKKIRVSKTTGEVMYNRLKLSDYLLYINKGVTCPTYHTNGNPLDCRISNIKKCRDKLRQKSSVKYMKNVNI